jgi:hypothetical protein
MQMSFLALISRKSSRLPLPSASMGKIYMVVHNAGYGGDCFLEDITEEFYTTKSDINLKGVELPQDDPS